MLKDPESCLEKERVHRYGPCTDWKCFASVVLSLILVATLVVITPMTYGYWKSEIGRRNYNLLSNRTKRSTLTTTFASAAVVSENLTQWTPYTGIFRLLPGSGIKNPSSESSKNLNLTSDTRISMSSRSHEPIEPETSLALTPSSSRSLDTKFSYTSVPPALSQQFENTIHASIVNTSASLVSLQSNITDFAPNASFHSSMATTTIQNALATSHSGLLETSQIDYSTVSTLSTLSTTPTSQLETNNSGTLDPTSSIINSSGGYVRGKRDLRMSLSQDKIDESPAPSLPTHQKKSVIFVTTPKGDSVISKLQNVTIPATTTPVMEEVSFENILRRADEVHSRKKRSINSIKTPAALRIRVGAVRTTGPDLSSTDVFSSSLRFPNFEANSKLLRDTVITRLKEALKEVDKTPSGKLVYHCGSVCVIGNEVWMHNPGGIKMVVSSHYCRMDYSSYEVMYCMKEPSINSSTECTKLESNIKGRKEAVRHNLTPNQVVAVWRGCAHKLKLMFWAHFFEFLSTRYPGFNQKLQDYTGLRHSRSCTTSGLSFLWIHPTVTCDNSQDIAQLTSQLRTQRQKDMSWVKTQITKSRSENLDMFKQILNTTGEIIQTLKTTSTQQTEFTSYVEVKSYYFSLKNFWRLFTNEYLSTLAEAEATVTFLLSKQDDWDLSYLSGHTRALLMKLPKATEPVGKPIIEVEKDNKDLIIRYTTLIAANSGIEVSLTPLEPVKIKGTWSTCPPSTLYLSGNVVWVLHPFQNLAQFPRYTQTNVVIPSTGDFFTMTSDTFHCTPFDQEHFETVFKGKCYAYNTRTNSESKCKHHTITRKKTLEEAKLPKDPPELKFPKEFITPFQSLTHSHHRLLNAFGNYSEIMTERLDLPIWGVENHKIHSILIDVHSCFSLIYHFVLLPLFLYYLWRKKFRPRFIKLELQVSYNNAVIDSMNKKVGDLCDHDAMTVIALPTDVPASTTNVIKSAHVNGRKTEITLFPPVLKGGINYDPKVGFTLDSMKYHRVLTNDQYSRLLQDENPHLTLVGDNKVMVAR